mmetsp:Transcript_21872/g.40235  ORF Transcript_21872/g.40235 Transcript_21872/m.40235 type:complete len:262 (-) Transcript_21872:103-888(-)
MASDESQAMLDGEKELHGEHHDLTFMNRIPMLLGLARADSMDVSNDPRFFSDNVLNYRLAAFNGLSVVSGLLVQNSMDHIFDMNKSMNPATWDGRWQLVSFCILNVCLFGNLLATYVGVAQPYHTIRLMTAGPTGFECAKSYYLDSSIIAWRHTAIKAMLLSLPLFVASQGLRLVVKFDRGTKADPDLPDLPPFYSKVESYVFSILMIVVGLLLANIHWKHSSVFRKRYADLLERPADGVYEHVVRLDRTATLLKDELPEV